MKEEKRVVVGNEEKRAYDPRKALMVTEDLVAAEKFFRFCVKQRNQKVILVAENLFDPAKNQLLRYLLKEDNEGSSGFIELISTDTVNGKEEIRPHFSDFMIKHDGKTEIISMKIIDAYMHIYIGDIKILAGVRDHYFRGKRKKRICTIKTPKVNLVPFTTIHIRL